MIRFTGAAFSPDGSRLLSYTSSRGEIAVWDWENKELTGLIDTGGNLTYACL